MKKLLALTLSTALLFSGCGGSSTIDLGDNASARYVSYSSSDFKMEVPDTWDTINDFTDEYPSGLRIAFKDNVQNTVFTANVTVLREENPEKLTSADYVQSKLQNHEDHLLNYELLSQDELTLTVAGADSATMLNTFSGKNTADGPSLEFMQVVLCKADRAWVVTATYRSDEDDATVEEMEHMLKSFAVK
jgi:hypothetical protein